MNGNPPLSITATENYTEGFRLWTGDVYDSGLYIYNDRAYLKKSSACSEVPAPEKIEKATEMMVVQGV